MIMTTLVQPLDENGFDKLEELVDRIAVK